ncbi:hypothetical protein EV174_006088, partial [Coemansia sp. RSA 2320]
MKVAAFAPVACFAAGVLSQGMPMPAGNIAPTIAAGSRTSTLSLLAHLASYFDMSHVSGAATSTPVSVVHVFDPASSKFTHLSMNVAKSGDAYYFPVCAVDSIVTAGSSAVAMPESCHFGIQLMPVPTNAMNTHMQVVHTLLRAIKSASHPSFWFGGVSVTHPPEIPQEQPVPERTPEQPAPEQPTPEQPAPEQQQQQQEQQQQQQQEQQQQQQQQ